MTQTTPERPVPSEGSVWLVRMAGEEFGPVGVEQLRDWRSQGRITPGSLVRAPSSEQWVPMAEVAELSDLAIAPPPPPAPPDPPQVARRIVPRGRVVCPCFECSGPVVNIARGWGFPWGFWHRAMRPEFRCARCNRPTPPGELTPAAQRRVRARRRRALVGWTITSILVIAGVAAPFIAWAYLGQ